MRRRSSTGCPSARGDINVIASEHIDINRINRTGSPFRISMSAKPDPPFLGRRTLVIKAEIPMNGVVFALPPRAALNQNPGAVGVVLPVIRAAIACNRIITAINPNSRTTIISANIPCYRVVVAGDRDSIIICIEGMIINNPVSGAVIPQAD